MFVNEIWPIRDRSDYANVNKLQKKSRLPFVNYEFTFECLFHWWNRSCNAADHQTFTG